MLDKKADREEMEMARLHPEYSAYLLSVPKFIPFLAAFGEAPMPSPTGDSSLQLEPLLSQHDGTGQHLPRRPQRTPPTLRASQAQGLRALG